MERIMTDYGPLEGVEYADFYDNGQPRNVVVSRRNVLETPAGALTPQYQDEDLRRPRVEPMTFHESGALRSLPLQERTLVPTPAGPVLAEQLTFHPSGAVRRVFPLAGKLSGHWSWQDEARLADPLTIATPAGEITARIISLLFFESGALRSVTLWPEERATLATPLGPVAVRIGLAFYESGALRSLEPAEPLGVDTPVGRLTAYDNDPEGISGDVNSLSFHPDGRLAGLSTVSDTIELRCQNGRTRGFRPRQRINPCDGEATELTPLAVRFADGNVLLAEGRCQEGDAVTFALADCQAKVTPLRASPFDIPYFCPKG